MGAWESHPRWAAACAPRSVPVQRHQHICLPRCPRPSPSPHWGNPLRGNPLRVRPRVICRVPHVRGVSARARTLPRSDLANRLPQCVYEAYAPFGRVAPRRPRPASAVATTANSRHLYAVRGGRGGSLRHARRVGGRPRRRGRHPPLCGMVGWSPRRGRGRGGLSYKESIAGEAPHDSKYRFLVRIIAMVDTLRKCRLHRPIRNQ